MNQKELKELIEFLIEKDIAEFELERGDVKVRIKRGVGARCSGSAGDPRCRAHGSGFGAGGFIRSGCARSFRRKRACSGG